MSGSPASVAVDNGSIFHCHNWLKDPKSFDGVPQTKQIIFEDEGGSPIGCFQILWFEKFYFDHARSSTLSMSSASARAAILIR